jgi:hypothetical protein
MKDNDSSGHPFTAGTDKKKMGAVCCLLIDLCCIFFQIIAEHLNTGRDTLHVVVEQNVGKRKVCARFVPRVSVMEQNQEQFVVLGPLSMAEDKNKKKLVQVTNHVVLHVMLKQS